MRDVTSPPLAHIETFGRTSDLICWGDSVRLMPTGSSKPNAVINGVEYTLYVDLVLRGGEWVTKDGYAIRQIVHGLFLRAWFP